MIVLGVLTMIVLAGSSQFTSLAQETQDSTFVKVQYFHPRIRCQTCVTIESFADAVMTGSFRMELALGKVRWQVTDYEKENDTSSVFRYGIENQVLIISRIVRGREIQWKNLTKVWKLVEDYQRFEKYLVKNVREMM